MGAATALTFARAHPGRVSGLMLDRPAIDEKLNSALEPQSNAALLRSHGIEGWMKELLNRHPAESRSFMESRYAAAWRRQDPACAAVAFEAVGSWQVAPLATLSSLQVPTVVRAWRRDPIHPLDLAKRIHRSLPHSALAVVSPVLLHDLDSDRRSIVNMLACLDRLARTTSHP